ncbi:hypothetical protein KL86SPO_40595 [uncultured Sporomusa sp.]|uniref:Uncharacterized protein n=1 Tax=uncultured Sporomusa sp. TaxID=307249 RepID=A0A212LXA5_9FIRM|nr:hypothetical protein KL86SPO_40595 [uncultured Sporomusa sp.]
MESRDARPGIKVLSEFLLVGSTRGSFIDYIKYGGMHNAKEAFIVANYQPMSGCSYRERPSIRG